MFSRQALLLSSVSLAQGSFSILSDNGRHGDHIELDTEKVKAGAKELLVDAAGTSKEGTGSSWIPSVDSIDRVLEIHWDIPEVEDFMTDDGVASCGKMWSCGDMHYETCPGMRVTTAQVRGYDNFPANFTPLVPWDASAPYHVPEFHWDTTAGKKYTLLFVDLMHPGSAFPFFTHSVIMNMVGDDVSTATMATPFLPSGNTNTEPNSYTFLVFEHDADLTGTYDSYETDLQQVMAKLGLSHTQLVAVNWYRASVSVTSLVNLAQMGFLNSTEVAALCVGLVDGSTDGTLDMCSQTIDHECADYVVTPTAAPSPATETTEAETTTSGSTGKVLGGISALVLLISA